MARAREPMLTVALAGNPNVGKSTLFNALTGLHQHTGNWPGKTVELAQGIVSTPRGKLRLVDLPGTYRLTGGSQEEQIAGNFLEAGEADCVIAVCDGSCLERSLILPLEILARCPRVVVCVNLMDEAARQGITVDGGALARELGVPVVLTSVGQKEGLRALLTQVWECSARSPEPQGDPIARAQALCRSCVTQCSPPEPWRLTLDRVLVSRRYGIPIMGMLLLGILWLTIWGANYPSRMLEALFAWGYDGLNSLRWPPLIRGLLLDGIYSTCCQVLAVMVPPMAIFFPLFTTLEDVGYLPRMAFLLDHGMRRCGGCGRQALTMCMGFGCNGVGVMGCRILDSPRERLAAMLTNSMIPCNGRFPALILLGTLFFGREGGVLAVAACMALGAAGAMVVSGGLRRTMLSGTPGTFLMELPPFRRPRLGQILVRSFLDRTMKMALRALLVSAPAGALLWLLDNGGLLVPIADFLDPLGRAMGMNGVLILGFLMTIPANELLIPVVMMVLTGGSLRGVSALGPETLAQAGWTWQTAVCAMAFHLFHWPCATTLQVFYRQTRDGKLTLAAALLPTAVGVLLCMMLGLLL